MPGKDLPLNNASMVTQDQMGYVAMPTPTDDACSLEGTNQNGVLGAPASMEAPLQPVSLATFTVEAPPNDQTWNSGDKGENWMDKTFPWQK